LEATRERIILEGEVPSPVNPPSGCVFHARCPRARPERRNTVPPLREVGDDHEVACLAAE
jgi:oligopeptide/dipeptide ABC transporter ATP-binding protein